MRFNDYTFLNELHFNKVFILWKMAFLFIKTISILISKTIKCMIILLL